ncbi:protein of unknown function [Magnetospirillum gryphiswaldense MSR-1 v2]|uniref:Uncharacterized protein n=1 Tax=Magnetospirillum gryphiswaldense (strain DSM 6361 / JCM 21280 / NBRC 15271 / MSR-1) TaxID=431944 RepID=V6F0J2_MAGGM|nr:protein of unknown function [Magnetospirillum gryphiswaldense MSR-1 v2]
MGVPQYVKGLHPYTLRLMGDHRAFRQCSVQNNDILIFNKYLSHLSLPLQYGHISKILQIYA